MESSIRRRDVLAGIGVGVLSGCLSNSAGDDPSTATPTGTADSSSISLDATVLQSFDAAHPARLQLTLANRTDDQLLSLGVRRGIDGPFTAIRGHRREDGRELLVFYRGRELDRYAQCAESSKTPIPDERVDGCWQPRCSEGLEVISTHGRVILEPGETLTGEYTLLDGFDEGCLAPGTYEFADEAAEVGRGTETEESVDFTSEPARMTRRLAVTLDDEAVSATAEAVVGTTDDTGSDTPTGPSPDTPKSTSK